MRKAWSFVEFGYGNRFKETLGFDKWHIGHSSRFGNKCRMRPYFAYQRRAEGAY